MAAHIVGSNGHTSETSFVSQYVQIQFAVSGLNTNALSLSIKKMSCPPPPFLHQNDQSVKIKQKEKKGEERSGRVVYGAAFVKIADMALLFGKL